MEMKALTCKNCGGQIKHQNINIQAAMAHCEYCGAVFSLSYSDQQVQSTGPSSAPQFRKRAPVPMPRKITVDHENGGLRIRRKWFSPKYIFILIFGLFWNGFMLGWHAIAISTGEYVMSLFGLIHTAVGLVLVYIILTGFLNTTYLEIVSGKLKVYHKPLPWPGKLSLDRTSVSQFFCVERISRNKNSVSYTYDINAKVRNGGTVRVVRGLEKSEQALFIEQELERYLGIIDEAVDGELTR